MKAGTRRQVAAFNRTVRDACRAIRRDIRARDAHLQRLNVEKLALEHEAVELHAVMHTMATAERLPKLISITARAEDLAARMLAALDERETVERQLGHFRLPAIDLTHAAPRQEDTPA